MASDSDEMPELENASDSWNTCYQACSQYTNKSGWYKAAMGEHRSY